jgi:hypothetical protein
VAVAPAVSVAVRPAQAAHDVSLRLAKNLVADRWAGVVQGSRSG